VTFRSYEGQNLAKSLVAIRSCLFQKLFALEAAELELQIQQKLGTPFLG
jgi:hypothetical protein